MSRQVPARRNGERTPEYYRRIYAAQGWKGILRRLATPPRRFRPTRAGWIYFAFMMITVFFAYATDNNLLFMLFAALLAVMSASGVLSEASLGPLHVRRRLPAEVEAGLPFAVRYEIKNDSRRLAAWAFRIRDAELFGKRPGPFRLHLKAAAEGVLEADAVLERRGLWQAPDYEIFTRHPFLLFDKSRSLPGGESLLVFPRSDRPVQLPWSEGREPQEGFEELKHESAAEGDSISFVRELKEGEAVRRIDWRKTARYDRLFRKEFERRQVLKVCVLFEAGETRNYEDGLEVCASLLKLLCRRRIPFALALGAQFSGYGEGHDHFIEQMRRLALYDGEKLLSPPQAEGIIIKVYGDGQRQALA